MREPALTRARAAAHETLFIKLGALTRQAEALARSRPGGAVPPETRAAAEALLYDAHVVLVGQPRRSKRPRELPVAAETLGGLATQLGQALARLDAYEAAHSRWNAELNCYAWQVAGDPLPVRRLRPELVNAMTERETREEEMIRKKIVARFAERYEEGFEAGLKAARVPGESLVTTPYGAFEIQNS